MKICSGPKPKKQVPCPVCKGAGKETIQSTVISPGKPDQKSSFDMICPVCQGCKTMNPDRAKAIEESRKREMELWCQCKESSNDVIFHDDGECRQCRKHHYHCGACGKITQVG